MRSALRRDKRRFTFFAGRGESCAVVVAAAAAAAAAVVVVVAVSVTSVTFDFYYTEPQSVT